MQEIVDVESFNSKSVPPPFIYLSLLYQSYIMMLWGFVLVQVGVNFWVGLIYTTWLPNETEWNKILSYQRIYIFLYVVLQNKLHYKSQYSGQNS